MRRPTAARPRLCLLAVARVRLWLLAAALIAAGPVPSPAQLEDPASPRDLEREFDKGLASRLTSDRLQAVERLVASGHPRAVELLARALQHTLKRHEKNHKRYVAVGTRINEMTDGRVWLDRPARSSKVAELQKEHEKLAFRLQRDEKVIAALRQGLGRLFASQPPEDQARTVALLRRRGRSPKPGARAALAETLGHLKGPGAVEALVPMAAAKEPAVRIAAIEALGRQGDRAAVVPLASALEDPLWQVRVAAVEALTRLGGKGAVDGLVMAMDRVEGRLTHDVVQALKRLTGQDFHENRVLWREWWAKNRADYTGPPVARAGEGRPLERRRGARVAGGDVAWQERTHGTTFYGIPTRSKRLVYILDISNSMNYRLRGGQPGLTGRRTAPIGERKIDQAIEELKRSITALPADATFNIVFYNAEIDVWRKHQIKATPANKKKAMAWADSVVASGNTNIFDALERAFRLAGRGTFDLHYPIEADTFYLLSDGRANRGRVVDGTEMRREVARLNKFQKVVVHTIALGNEHINLPFMRGLAEDTGGEFVHIGARGRSR